MYQEITQGAARRLPHRNTKQVIHLASHFPDEPLAEAVLNVALNPGILLPVSQVNNVYNGDSLSAIAERLSRGL